MKYLIETNQGDFIFEKKRAATAWLKDLHQQNPKITSLWVYDNEGMWIDSAEIVDGTAKQQPIYPDGAYRMWVVWACQLFDNNSYCASGYENAYYSVLRLDKSEDKTCSAKTGTSGPIYSLRYYYGERPLKEIKKICF